MPLGSKTFFARSVATFAFLAAFALSGTELRAQASPFNGLEGNWSGTGTITLSNGSNERIRCRATYAVANNGDALQQSLRCASDSYRFELGSEVVHQGGNITGRWSEATRNVGGSVVGRVVGGQIAVRVDAPGFSAELTLVTQGGQQSVAIRSQSTELTAVNITLAKGK